METVFSGIQPSGALHLGNYLGAVRTWVELQQSYRCFYCIVDYHAITQSYEPAEMSLRVREMAIDLLACGIDPERATLFVQSAVPEHTELAWALSSVAPYGELGRMTQFKDKAEHQPDNINAGIFTYPILQTADILLYGATRVPVGEDQRQHLELAREIVRRWNARFGDTFAEPQPLFSTTPKLLGLDGQTKMSKSRGNTISLREPEKAIWDKLRTAATDPARVRRTDPGNPDVCNIFTLHKFFSNAERQEAGARRLHDRGHRLHRLQEDAVRGAEGRPGANRGACRRAERDAGPGRRDPGRGRIARAHGGARDAGARARAPRPHHADRAMTTLRTAIFIACAAVVTAGAACSTRDDGSSPESAVQLLLASVRAGDREAVFNRFGPRTRAHIEELLASAHKTGGTRMLRPQDLVTVGWVPPAWEPAGLRTLSRNGDDAEVEVYSAAGDRQTVHLVREGKTWKVELPLR